MLHHRETVAVFVFLSCLFLVGPDGLRGGA